MEPASPGEAPSACRECQHLCQLLSTTLECSTDGLLVVNAAGRFVAFNQRFVQMWSLPNSIAEAPDDSQALAWVLDQLVEPSDLLSKVQPPCADPDYRGHDVLRCKDGRIIERTLQPLRIATEYAGRVWSFRDVTEHRRAERERERTQHRYQELVESIDGIVWECDLRTNCFLVINKQAERLLGYPLGRWLTEPNFWQDIMHPDDRPWAVKFCADQTALLKNHQLDYRLIAADGRVVWLRDLVTVVVEDGVPVCLRGVMIDITEKVHSQQQLDLLLVAERTQRAEAEAAVRVRDEFLSIASHELRTPVTSLQLAVQSLLRLARKDPHASQPPPLLASALLVVERQSRRLRGLIDTLLDVSRLTAGRIDLEAAEADLAAIARDVARNFSEDFAAAGCTLRLQAAAPVCGYWDRSRIEQVISNLLSNAIKYGPGKEVRLQVEQSGGMAKLVVQDHGIGIGQSDREKIFERFARAVSARHYGGLGLGLYISRLLVQAHGGTIHVESQPAAGATFTVVLPLLRRS